MESTQAWSQLHEPACHPVLPTALPRASERGLFATAVRKSTLDWVSRAWTLVRSKAVISMGQGLGLLVHCSVPALGSVAGTQQVSKRCLLVPCCTQALPFSGCVISGKFFTLSSL